MDRKRLAANLPGRFSVGQWLLATIKIADAPRRQQHSGAIERLKDPQRARPEKQKERQRPPPESAAHRLGRKTQAQRKRDRAAGEPAPPLARPDVFDTR